ncbi:hypothetical protein OESDEN_03650 [Oesophagostomum dentatum]|uniref:Uncharacterized protein n=1 Tax=Oesophagostomum dentatum TaxID=61180 RepID=A0A0B1TGJ6_OESDE|nr:hypothetical protein OESDEN_03650 [Oesophagostomum dentatum]
MRSETPLLRDEGDISEFEMNALCMRYGIAASPTPNENALLTATSTVVRDNLKCYQPKKSSKGLRYNCIISIEEQYEAALKAIRDRRAELLAAKMLLNGGGFVLK